MPTPTATAFPPSIVNTLVLLDAHTLVGVLAV